MKTSNMLVLEIAASGANANIATSATGIEKLSPKNRQEKKRLYKTTKVLTFLLLLCKLSMIGEFPKNLFRSNI
jgi:hypothetical protein